MELDFSLFRLCPLPLILYTQGSVDPTIQHNAEDKTDKIWVAVRPLLRVAAILTSSPAVSELSTMLWR